MWPDKWANLIVFLGNQFICNFLDDNLTWGTHQGQISFYSYLCISSRCFEDVEKSLRHFCTARNTTKRLECFDIDSYRSRFYRTFQKVCYRRQWSPSISNCFQSQHNQIDVFWACSRAVLIQFTLKESIGLINGTTFVLKISEKMSNK